MLSCFRLIALLPVFCSAQPYFNLDFETSSRGRIRSWSVGNPGYEYAIDSGVKFSGEQSFRIRNTGAPDTGLGVGSQTMPIDLVRGKTVRFSGWMKTDGVSPGYAALWLRVDGPNGYLSLDNMSAFGPRGTTDWTQFEFTRVINTSGLQVVFGFFLSGRGTAWFDNLQIEIDGQPVAQNPPFIGEPTTEQLDWIKQSAIPFRSPNAGTPSDDLAPLRNLIGNARVVGLGEATHGTSEFFRMKHRLLEYLATNMGFTIFSIEASMPESYRVNDYVLTGRGDPKALLKGMYFWTWNTQEVLDMIEWMRQFNASGKGRVQFTGYDMQTWNVAGGIALAFLQANDPDYYPTAQAAYNLVAQTRSLAVTTANLPRLMEAAEAAKNVRLHMEEAFAEYLKKATLAESDWAVQNARVAEMAAYSPVGGTYHRDEMMAFNTWWILDQNPSQRYLKF
ncbi:MAG: erythromycin esterase family protein [Acidobacteria bacterium]|nr:erythromycin esterase family protein [Acidobacteriota bacterium]